MPQPLDLNRLLEAGRQLTESGRSQARDLGTDLVAQGRVASEYVSAVVDDLVGRPGRERTEELRQAVRAEVEHQLSTLGAALQEDVASTARVAVDQINVAGDELRDQLQANAGMLRDAVRDEVQRQLRGLGLATQADLARLETAVRASLDALERTFAAAAGSGPEPGGTSLGE
jgi:polyhydroxyalkanoate synthesis regulator phasin